MTVPPGPTAMGAQQMANAARLTLPAFLSDPADAECLPDLAAILEAGVRDGTPDAFAQAIYGAHVLLCRRNRLRLEFRVGVGLGASHSARPGDVLWVPTKLAQYLVRAGSAVLAPEGEPVPSARPHFLLRFLRGVVTSTGDKQPGDTGRLHEGEAQRLVLAGQARLDEP